jgi:hypothetical protein
MRFSDIFCQGFTRGLEFWSLRRGQNGRRLDTNRFDEKLTGILKLAEYVPVQEDYLPIATSVTVTQYYPKTKYSLWAYAFQSHLIPWGLVIVVKTA